MDVISDIRQKNITITSANAFDFSTLYTKLPHEVIEKSMFTLVDKLFNNQVDKYIAVTNNTFKPKIFYTSKTGNWNLYSKEDVKNLIHTIITESYITIGNTILRQNSGIPMGGNASPLIADLTLSMLEFQYLNKNYVPKKTCLYRYIDDILSINYNFNNIYSNIYPKELELNCDMPKNDLLNYLDVTFKLHSHCTKIYNKVDVFQFDVIRAPDKQSCIHSQQINGIIMGQLIRYARITSEFNDWLASTVKLACQFNNKGHSRVNIMKAVCKFCARYKNLLYKYKILENKEAVHKIVEPIFRVLR
jgi:hypothetical protein